MSIDECRMANAGLRTVDNRQGRQESNSGKAEFRDQKPECRMADETGDTVAEYRNSSPPPSPQRGEGERSKGEEGMA